MGFHGKYSVLLLSILMMSCQTLQQSSSVAKKDVHVGETWRFRSDTNSPDGGLPTWETTEDQATPLVWEAGKPIRLRYVVSNQSGASYSGQEADILLRYRRNGGDWASVGAQSNVVRGYDVTGYKDGIPIQPQNFLLSAGTGTPHAGSFDGTGFIGDGLIELPGNTYAEYEHALTVVSGEVAAGDLIEFQVVHKHPAFTPVSVNWQNTPTISVR